MMIAQMVEAQIVERHTGYAKPHSFSGDHSNKDSWHKCADYLKDERSLEVFPRRRFYEAARKASK